MERVSAPACSSVNNFDQVYDYKLGCSKGNVKLVLLGAGRDKEKCYNDLLSGVKNSDIEALLNKPLNDSGANRKKVVGDMPKLVDEFSKLPEVLNCKTSNEILDKWEEFYTEKQPTGIQDATKILFDFFIRIQSVSFTLSGCNMPEDLRKTYRDMCEAYVRRLILIQTPFGLLIEKMILTNLSSYLGIKYVKNFNEEAKGIDARIDDIPITVKPESYKGDGIATGTMIKYGKEKDNLSFVFQSQIPNEWIRCLAKNSHNKTEIDQIKKLDYLKTVH